MPSWPLWSEADLGYWAVDVDVGSCLVKEGKEVKLVTSASCLEGGNWAKSDPRWEGKGGRV